MVENNEDVKLPALPPNTKNYMTPACYRRLLDEREHLVNVERPDVVNVVAWAASNGDRSENGDYLYGKKRLREIDRRIRFLNKKRRRPRVQTNRVCYFNSFGDHDPISPPFNYASNRIILF